jgi:hypothetical protein
LIKIEIYLSLASIKDAQAKGEAFSPQKRTSSPSKHDFFYFYLFFRVIFALLDQAPDPATQINADPDPIPGRKSSLTNFFALFRLFLCIIYFYCFIHLSSTVMFLLRSVSDSAARQRSSRPLQSRKHPSHYTIRLVWVFIGISYRVVV